jgi:drug/metabolite transporter (DMT)-like permease
VLFVRGIRRASALEGALLILLTPLWAFLAVGETMTGQAAVGGAIIFLAALARTWASLRGLT